MKKIITYIILLFLPCFLVAIIGYLTMNEMTAIICFSVILIYLLTVSLKGSYFLIYLLGGQLPRRGHAKLQQDLKNLSLREGIKEPALYISGQQNIPIIVLKNLFTPSCIILNHNFNTIFSDQEKNALIRFELAKVNADFFPLKNILVFYHCMDKTFNRLLNRAFSWLSEENLNFLMNLFSIFKKPLIFLSESFFANVGSAKQTLENFDKGSNHGLFLYSAFTKIQYLDDENTVDMGPWFFEDYKNYMSLLKKTEQDFMMTPMES